MVEFRRGDVCSLEVVVSDVHDDGTLFVVTDETPIDSSETLHVYANAVTLIRRAPVDLATCELPVEVVDADDSRGVLDARGGCWGLVKQDNGRHAPWLLSDLRPADAPAPAAEAGEAERLRAANIDALVSRFLTWPLPSSVCSDMCATVHSYDGPRSGTNLLTAIEARAMLEHVLGEALASTASHRKTLVDEVSRETFLGGDPEGFTTLGGTAPSEAPEKPVCGMRAAIAKHHATPSDAPSCPPGHVLINSHVVPEPMREAPAPGTKYWTTRANRSGEACVDWFHWGNSTLERTIMFLGGCHSTEAAARAHAEALIAPTKREGV